MVTTVDVDAPNFVTPKVKVTESPTFTELGLAVMFIERAGAAVIAVAAEPCVEPETGLSDVTVAWLVSVPTADGDATTVLVAISPALKSPRMHVTVRLLVLKLHPELAEENSRFCGRTSAIVTAVDVDAPTLVADNAKLTGSPTNTVSRLATLVSVTAGVAVMEMLAVSKVVPPEATDAMLEKVPGADGKTEMVLVAVAPIPMLPSEHVTVLLLESKLQPALAEENSRFPGKTSVTVTLGATTALSLEAIRVNVTVSPTRTVVELAPLVSERSTGGTMLSFPHPHVLLQEPPVNPSLVARPWIMALIWAASRVGSSASSRATAPATCGEAMLVPRRIECSPPGVIRSGIGDVFTERAEAIFSPGPAISGLLRPSLVGPLLENDEISPTVGSGK